MVIVGRALALCAGSATVANFLGNLEVASGLKLKPLGERLTNARGFNICMIKKDEQRRQAPVE